MELHYGTVFEAIADEMGAAPALVHGSERLSWERYDQQAARFASFIDGLGLKPDSKVALYLYNGNEYLVAQYGAFKQRCVPVNVNYRYLDHELAYLLDNSDAEVLVYHASLGEHVAAVQHACPGVKAWVEVDDRGGRRIGTSVTGALRWTDVLAAHPPAPRIERSPDDLYLLYTGGTTGMPKGVMFRQEDHLRRLFGGYVYRQWTPPTGGHDLLDRIREHVQAGDRRVSIPACPLMHATGMWLGALYAHLMGGTTVTLTGRHFDADELWRTAQDERADAVTIVGDAFARPMLAALDAAADAGHPYDLSALTIIQSSGVMWSAEIQQGLLRHLDVRLLDSMGSTEAGMGRRIATRATPIATATFDLLPTSRVITDDHRLVAPGSGEVGRIAAGSFVPIGYFKDPEKSAATFPVIDGVRYSLAGDHATVDADGSLVLLGRGSGCINTAGEKVFPEEVEESLKRHPQVSDCLVVGLPDERFGERIAAVVALAPGSHITPEQLIEHVRSELAGYKVPRSVRIVATVQRAANGKADYPWARTIALGA